MGWVNVIRFPAGYGIFSLRHRIQTALETTQTATELVPGALSLGLKRPGREADHFSPSSAEVRNPWNYTSTPQNVFMAWDLVKNRDYFTFTIAILLQ
jgi:hypothetical protein